MIDDNFGHYMSSLEKYQEAADIFRNLGDKKGEASELIRIGVVRQRNGNFDQAILQFLRARDLSAAIKDTVGLMESNVTLAESYAGLRRFNIASAYLDIAEDLDAKLPFSSLRLNMYNNRGLVFGGLGQFDYAERYLLKGLKLAERPGMEGLHITLSNTLALVYEKIGRKEEALAILNRSLKRSREIKNFIREGGTLAALGDYYEKRDHALAIKYYSQLLAISRKNSSYQQEIIALNKLANLHFLDGRYKLSYQQKRRSHELADSVFYKFMNSEVANLQARQELLHSQQKVQELKYTNELQSLEKQKIWGLVIALLLVIGVFIFYYNRTVRLNRLLRGANTDLKESNSVKDKLFSIIAHDLRQPIASVINLMPLIADDDTTEEERRLIADQLLINSRASLETLNQLLRWGEMQIKGVHYNPSLFEVAPEINRNISLLKPTAEGKSITIESSVAEGTVFADKDHFNFIIRNLMSNAVKFTRNGGHVRVFVENLPGDRIKISVKDNGVGIPAKRINTIFQINSTSTKGTNNEKGTSLGLVMCKEFIDANGGEISVSSIPEEGSVFSIILKTSQNTVTNTKD